MTLLGCRPPRADAGAVRRRVRRPRPASSRGGHRVASLDLGTNTFRLLIADVAAGRATGSPRPRRVLAPILVRRIITRLGGGAIGRPPVIRDEALRRARSALREFRRIIDREAPERVEAVATHIVREAKNRDAFVALVREELGCPLRVIPSEIEARLALRGVLSVLGADRRVLLMDVGGGSTEYTLYHPPRVAAVEPTTLGVVSLTEAHLHHDPPLQDERETLRRHIEKRLEHVYSRLKGEGLRTGETVFAGTAGTVTTLAMMDMGLREYRPERINNHVLDCRSVSALYDRFAGMSSSERLRLPGLEKGREDVIVAGALLVLGSMKVLGFRRMTVSDGGILEGILLGGEAERT